MEFNHDHVSTIVLVVGALAAFAAWGLSRLANKS